MRKMSWKLRHDAESCHVPSRYVCALGFLELDICIPPILQGFPAYAGHRCCPTLCWKLVEVPCVTIGLEEVHIMFNPWPSKLNGRHLKHLGVLSRSASMFRSATCM
jgi:hypothetical protein